MFYYYVFLFYFFFNVTSTTVIYTYGHTLSLLDALPIWIAPSSDRIAKVIIFGRFGLTNASLRKFSSTSATRLISIWSDSPGRAFLKGVGSKAVKGGS